MTALGSAALRAIAASLLLLAAACGAAGDDDAEALTDADESFAASATIRGVKWKQEMAEQDRAKSARLETGGLSYAKAAKKLVATGVRDIVIRVPGEEIFETANGQPRPGEFARWDDEVVKMLIALEDASPDARVYLWKRQWMQRAGDGGKVADTHGVEEFAAEMARVVKLAKARGVAHMIAGVAAIETNIESSKASRRLALATAKRLNEKTNGWLEKKAFFWPGAGMGSYFVGIGDGGEFFKQMARQVGRFSFIYKHMVPCESKNESTCAIRHLNKAWEKHVSHKADAPVERQVKFLRDTMGLGDLNEYLSDNAERHPKLANVMFWGDQGDGVILMSPSNLAAVHQLLVEEMGSGDYFFDMAYAPRGATNFQSKKYLLDVRGDGTVTTNESAWKTWSAWSTSGAAAE